MKLFIIHASAGAGHKKIAEAALEEALQSYSKEDAAIFDLLDFTPYLYKLIYSQGYILLISKAKWIWKIFFYLADTKLFQFLNMIFFSFLNRVSCRRFLKFIEKEQPEAILSTHFLVNELLSYLKETGRIKSTLFSIITDFGVHNFWLAPCIDTYIAASEKTKEILIEKGIGQNKIKVLGIPTRRQFSQNIDRMALRKKWGIEEKAFCALILTGGIGMGPIHKIVQLLEDNIYVIVVCGTNKKLFEQLKKLNFKRLIIFGWIDNVQEAMAVSDIIITKPGGSSISEAIVMEKPMIFFSIIPGQEAENARLITEYKAGLIIPNALLIKKQLLFYRDNPSELENIKNNIRELKLSNPGREIIKIVQCSTCARQDASNVQR